MKTLKNFEFDGASRSTYDWNMLLNGKIYEMESGVDFTCKSVAFVSLARSTAKKRGLKVQIANQKNGNVVIQMIGPNDLSLESDDAPKAEPKAKPSRRKSSAKVTETTPDGDYVDVD